MTAAPSAVSQNWWADEAWRATPAVMAAHLDPRQFKLYRHFRFLGLQFARAALGISKRQIWLVSGRGQKSSVASRWGPVWALDLDPTLRFIVGSYNDELARSHGRWARNALRIYPELSVRLTEDSTAAGRWDTPQGGGMFCAGLGAGMVGWGANGMVIDDPHPDMPAARSAGQSAEVYERFRSTVQSRLEPGNFIIIAMHRLAPTDLVGRIMQGEDAASWEVIRLPALAEAPDPDNEDPLLRMPDPLGRKPGEALCPERFNEEELAETRRAVGPVVFDSMWQQRPHSKIGGLFPRANWKLTTERAPKRARRVRRWDLAGTEGGGDETVGTLMAKDGDRVVIEDIVAARLDPDGVEQLVVATARTDGPSVFVRLEQEPGSSGKSVALHMKRLIRSALGVRWTVDAQPSSGSKIDRALPLSAAVIREDVELLCYPDGTPRDWHERLIDQAADFPRPGGHDDIVDATSSAFNDLDDPTFAANRRPAKVTSLAGRSVGPAPPGRR
jgi:predicted phage terminase large subunit-like protein